MAHVLHIQASPRGRESFSIRTAEAFLAAYAESHPDDTTETLDLVKAPPLPFRADEAGAKMQLLAGQAPTDRRAEAWKKVVRTIEHFKRADKIVLSSPMWNFGVPYSLKHYIDVLVQPCETFRYTADGRVEGLVKGRPAMLILARGGRYGPGSGGEAMDYQLPYLKAILGFIGFEKVDAILVEPTAAGGPGGARKVLEAAIAEACRKGPAF